MYQIYHTWIHPLHCSLSSPLPWSAKKKRYQKGVTNDHIRKKKLLSISLHFNQVCLTKIKQKI
jgi:hypothetical protein